MASQFGKYVCIGDTIEIEREGYTFKVRVEQDDITHISDSECYTGKQIAAWQNDGWFYCGLVCSTWLGDQLLDDSADSLRGIECNFPESDNSYLNEIVADLFANALDNADDARQKAIARLTNQLTALEAGAKP